MNSGEDELFSIYEEKLKESLDNKISTFYKKREKHTCNYCPRDGCSCNHRHNCIIK